MSLENDQILAQNDLTPGSHANLNNNPIDQNFAKEGSNQEPATVDIYDNNITLKDMKNIKHQ